jgi:hypothetical protein
MSETIRITAPTSHQLAYAEAALAVVFRETPADDPAALLQTARGLLAAHQPATPQELQLTVQIVACEQAFKTCVRAALASLRKSFQLMMQLQRDALNINTVGLKASKLLKKRQQARLTTPHLLTEATLQWDERGFQAVIIDALQKMAHANARLSELQAPPPPKPPKLLLIGGEPMTAYVLANRQAAERRMRAHH